jgi:hypothetical protein
LLADGQVRVRVEHFAFTANNITCAVFGDSLQYWRFFPASEGEGCVPVWGHAEVEASACEGVAVGERPYGYWPMATHAWLRPASITPDGVIDASEHRRDLPAVYNAINVSSAQAPTPRAWSRCSSRCSRPRG